MPQFVRIIKLGDRGQDVKEVQKKLNSQGYNAGSEDGIFGETTRKAVMQFQRNKGLTVDGIVGPITYNALFNDKGKPSISINLSEKKLYFYSNSQLDRTFPVAVGKNTTPTPAGNWMITKKGLWGRQFGGYFMQLSIPWGTYGIHATNKPWTIGKAVSNGCIRMYNQDAKYIYDRVAFGTEVKIHR